MDRMSGMDDIASQSWICPACGDRMYVSDADAGIPSVWNRCCSPECGNRMSGIVEANPSHPKALAWEAMDARITAAYAERDAAQAACDHNWQDEPKDRLTRRSFHSCGLNEQGELEMGEFAALECTICHAAKPGARLH